MNRTEEHIRALCKWPHRGTTSLFESFAAEYARNVLEIQGHRVDVEQFRAPDSALYRTYMLIAACAGLACVIAFANPTAAVAVALLPFIYLFCEFYLLLPVHNLLYPTGISKNVVAREQRESAKARVVLTAHLDTQLGGYMFSPKWAGYQPLIINCASGGAVVAVFLSLFRTLGWDCWFVGTFQILDIILLAVLFALYAYAEWSGAYVQGANDDASGAAVILSLAEDLKNTPTENLEVWVVATGAEESGLCGMTHFLRKGMGRRLDKKTTYFINFDNLGSGELIYLTGETIPGFKYPGPLAPMAAELSHGSGSQIARPAWWGVPTDALAPALRGFPTVTIFGLDSQNRTPHYHHQSDTVENLDFDLPERARAFALDLIRKLDQSI